MGTWNDSLEAAHYKLPTWECAKECEENPKIPHDMPDDSNGVQGASMQDRSLMPMPELLSKHWEQISYKKGKWALFYGDIWNQLYALALSGSITDEEFAQQINSLPITSYEANEL